MAGNVTSTRRNEIYSGFADTVTPKITNYKIHFLIITRGTKQ